MKEMTHISPYRKKYSRLDLHLILYHTRCLGITFYKIKGAILELLIGTLK